MLTPLILYTRPGCHLCDDMKAQLKQFSGKLQFSLKEVNIDDDPELQKLYGESIPVLTIAGKTAFKGRMKTEEFLTKFHRITQTVEESH